MFYSQFGEDKIINDIFGQKTDGFCVEVGANNGIDDSTSYFFETLGWQCLLVEPNPILCQKIRAARRALLYECAASNRNDKSTLYVVEGAERSDGLSTISTKEEVHDAIKNHGFVSNAVQVRTMTLDEILTDARVDRPLDFISIDVEGHEQEVLEGFSLEKWKPSIMLVEDNSNFENNNVSRYLRSRGYVRFKRTGVNDWYAHRRNKRLINLRNRFEIAALILQSRLKSRLRKIPAVMKLSSILKSLGSK